MVKTKLVNELINDGAELLHELDCHNFPVESMLDSFAGSGLLATGDSFAHRRRTRRRGSIPSAGLDIAGDRIGWDHMEDISVLDLDSQQFQSFLSVASASSRLAAGTEWLKFEDAIVYRWTGASVSGALACEVSRNELKQFWEVERKMMSLSLPALLIEWTNDGDVAITSPTWTTGGHREREDRFCDRIASAKRSSRLPDKLAQLSRPGHFKADPSMEAERSILFPGNSATSPVK